MPPVRFEPTISAGERPQTYALDLATTGTDTNLLQGVLKISFLKLPFFAHLFSSASNFTTEIQGHSIFNNVDF